MLGAKTRARNRHGGSRFFFDGNEQILYIQLYSFSHFIINSRVTYYV